MFNNKKHVGLANPWRFLLWHLLAFYSSESDVVKLYIAN